MSELTELARTDQDISPFDYAALWAAGYWPEPRQVADWTPRGNWQPGGVVATFRVVDGSALYAVVYNPDRAFRSNVLAIARVS